MNHVNIRLRLAKVPYTHGIPDELVQLLVWNGQLGVQIFFAVSGFLITSTSLRRWNGLANVDVTGFYRLRFARIAPLLLLLLAILCSLHFAHFKDFVVTAQRGGLGPALLAALTFRVNVHEARHGYLPGSWDILWSLSVEEMFYLFFPIICRVFGRGRLLIAILLGFVVIGPFGRTVWASGLWKEYSYLGGMDAIALGCLTALAVARIRFPRGTGVSGAAMMIFVLGFSKQVQDLGLGRSGLDMTILAVGTCMVIAASVQTDWRSPVALHPVLRLGERSYEVYLTHMFVVFAFFNLFVLAGKPMSLVAALFVTVILIAGVLGAAVAHLYSEPMNRLLRSGLPKQVYQLRV
jgi:peptidoglycan/LPS O-acetylase OafA/YrhL